MSIQFTEKECYDVKIKNWPGFFWIGLFLVFIWLSLMDINNTLLSSKNEVIKVVIVEKVEDINDVSVKNEKYCQFFDNFMECVELKIKDNKQ